MKKLQVVELADILAIRIACANCHTSTSLPLDQYEKIRTHRCVVCTGPATRPDAVLDEMFVAARALKAVSQASAQGADYALSFEVEEQSH